MSALASLLGAGNVKAILAEIEKQVFDFPMTASRMSDAFLIQDSINMLFATNKVQYLNISGCRMLLAKAKKLI